MNDFFISYRNTDRAWAEWIAFELTLAGYEVLIQAWDFRDGQPIHSQINDALDNSRVTLAVLSPGYFESKWCELEWQIGRAHV